MFMGIGVVRVGHLRPFVYGTENKQGVEVSGYVDRGGKVDGEGKKISDRHKFVELDSVDALNLLNNFAKKNPDGSFETNLDGTVKSNGRNILMNARPQAEKYESKHKVTLTMAQLQAAIQSMVSNGTGEITLEFPVTVYGTTFLIDKWHFVDAPKAGNAPVTNNAPTIRFSVTNGPVAAATGGPATTSIIPALSAVTTPVEADAPAEKEKDSVPW